MKVEVLYSTHWSERQSRLTPGVTEKLFVQLSNRYPNCIDRRNFKLWVEEGSSAEEEALNFFRTIGLEIQPHKGALGSLGVRMKCTKRRTFDDEELKEFSYWQYFSHEAYSSAESDFVDSYDLKPVGSDLSSSLPIASISPFASGSWPAVEKQMADEIDKWGFPGVVWRSVGEVRGREIFIMQSSLPPVDILNDCVYANGDLIPYGEEPTTDLKGVIPIEGNFGIPMIRVSAESLSSGDVFQSQQKFSHQRGIRPYPMAIFSTRFKEKIDALGYEHISWRPVVVE
jgi:hypothetical protein